MAHPAGRTIIFVALLCLAGCVVTLSCDGGKGRDDGGKGRDDGARDDGGTRDGHAQPAEMEQALAEPVGADSVSAYVLLREMGYAAAEPVPMKLVVRNETDRTLHFTFPTAQRFDFVVRKYKEPVWSWSEGRMFAQSRGRLAIGPGDSLSYEYTWDGRLADGKLPRLGRYWVRGALMTAPPIETEERQFGIVD